LVLFENWQRLRKIVPVAIVKSDCSEALAAHRIFDAVNGFVHRHEVVAILFHGQRERSPETLELQKGAY
jgi:hypothetical protein